MYEQVCYGKNYLKEVIARIDFATPLEKLDKGPPPKLVRSIVKNFPIVEPTEVLLQEISVEPNAMLHKQTETKHWNYYSKQRESRLALSSQFIYVTHSRYTTFEDTKAQFAAVVDALQSSFPETLVSRFGLRYVNQFDLPLDNPTDWSTYIAEDLIAPRRFFTSDPVSRHITVTELRHGDMRVRFQCGMPNPDHPAVIKRPLYVLDIDASVSEAHDLMRAMDYMDEAHDHVQRLFERSILDALREKMNGGPVQQ